MSGKKREKSKNEGKEEVMESNGEKVMVKRYG